MWNLVAGAGLSLAGGIFGSKSAKKAAEERQKAFFGAMEDLGVGYDDAQEFLDPRYQQEQAAMDVVNSLLGLGGEAPDYSIFTNSPGYQFMLDQGTQAIERSAAARGGLNSGNTLAAATQYATGLADQTFNNYLATVLGLQSQGVDTMKANLAYGYGKDKGNLRIGAGNARASGIEDSANALLGGIGGAAGFLGEAFGKKGP